MENIQKEGDLYKKKPIQRRIYIKRNLQREKYRQKKTIEKNLNREKHTQRRTYIKRE